MDLEEQYDKIYRYCYFKVNNRELAEDITQEAFLRFFDSKSYSESGKSLRYLYTIARNLCIDEYRKADSEELCESLTEDCLSAKGHEDEVINKIVMNEALSQLSLEDRELILLRYVNEVPLATICNLFKMSRFALYRRLSPFPMTIGEVIIIYVMIYFIEAVLFAVLTMFFSQICRNSIASMGIIIGFLLMELCLNIPNQYRVIAQIFGLLPRNVIAAWSLFDANIRFICLTNSSFYDRINYICCVCNNLIQILCT